MAFRGIPLHRVVVAIGMVTFYLGFFIVRGLLAWCSRHVRRAKMGKLRGAGAYDLADFSESEREMVGLAESPHPLAGHVLGVGQLEPFVDQRGDTGLRPALQANSDIWPYPDWDGIKESNHLISGMWDRANIKQWDQSG